MSIQKFARKITWAMIVYTVLLIAIRVLFGFADVFIQNQLALGQMQSSNEAHAAFLGLQILLRHRNAVYFFIWGTFTGYVVREVHKHNKKVKGETNK